MSLSARDQRVLLEMDRDLAVEEPRLQRALVTGKLPSPGLRPLVMSHNPQRSMWVWIAVMFGSLLCGIGLLVAGSALHQFVLIWAGIPLAQFGPFAVGYLGHRAHRRSPRRRRVAQALSARWPAKRRCGENYGSRTAGTPHVAG